MKTNILRSGKRVLSVLFCVALFMTLLPVSSLSAAAAPASATVTDHGTAHTWEKMMGTDADGNRYAGRVWADKSVYAHGDTVMLNSRGEAGSSFQCQFAVCL